MIVSGEESRRESSTTTARNAGGIADCNVVLLLCFLNSFLPGPAASVVVLVLVIVTLKATSRSKTIYCCRVAGLLHHVPKWEPEKC